MKTNFTFRVLVLCAVLLTFNSHYAFSRARPTKSGADSVKAKSGSLLIDYHKGIHGSNAQHVALLVAQELRKQGIRVGDPVYKTPASGTVYRVVLRRSNENKKILFRLSEENTDGTIIVAREMLLEDIEEIVSAVPRLVYALVHRKPIASDVARQNSVEVQAKMAAKRDAETDTNKQLWTGVGCAVPFSVGIGGFVGGSIGYRIRSSSGFLSTEEICLACLGATVGYSIPFIAMNTYQLGPPPERLLGKSPQYIDFYTDAYKTRVQQLRRGSAARGALTSLGLGALVLVGLATN